MKVATFNCNSVRLRTGTILDWLAENEPDVLALQETKVEDSKFPIFDFEELGWNVVLHGQKSLSGVALISRHSIENVRIGMGDPLFPDDARIIAATVNGMNIVNTYVPNGTKVGTDKWEYKLRWLERFRRYIAEHRPDVWVGDINIARHPEDVYDSPRMFGGVGHHPDEFKRLDAITSLGMTDVFRQFHQGPGFYSYWEFYIKTAFERNNGWRIDHIYARDGISATSCEIDIEPRKTERPSDHTIVWAEFAT